VLVATDVLAFLSIYLWAIRVDSVTLIAFRSSKHVHLTSKRPEQLQCPHRLGITSPPPIHVLYTTTAVMSYHSQRRYHPSFLTLVKYPSITHTPPP